MRDPPTGVRTDKSGTIHESGPKSQSDVIYAKGTRFDKPIEIMEMRTHRDKRRDGGGKGDGTRDGGGGDQGNTRQTGEMQIAVIDCIHEPRSTPTRVIRGNARAYWGARYNRRGARLFTNRDARNYFDRAKPTVARECPFDLCKTASYAIR